MIIKKSVMQKKDVSSYARLSEYIMNEKTEGKIRNVAMWTNSEFDNDDIDLFIKDVEIVQKSNTLSHDDKTYHLIVSFRENEIDIQKLKDIEKDIVVAMGFEKHQRLCVVHNDTDNVHFHIAINKVNPETNKIYTPYRDYNKLNDIAVAIEDKYSLIKDNHIRSEQPYSKALDIEKSGYMRSLQSYIKDINLDNISNWKDFHEELNKYGIKYTKSGAGAVFVDKEKNIYVKASNINKEYTINKLESKYGTFIPYNYKDDLVKDKYEKKAINDNGIYNDYIKYKENRSDYLKQEIKNINNEYNKSLSTSLYDMKALLNKTLLNNASYIERLVINKTFKHKMERRKKSLLNEKHKKKEKLYKDNPYNNFDEWVKKEALSGNIKAKNYIETQISKENYIIADFSSEIKKAIKVTKNGTYITSDNKRIHNNNLNVRSSNEYVVLSHLKYYQNLYPNEPLKIVGTDKFKEQVINVILKYQLDISFKDEMQQAKLQTAILDKKQEENNILKSFNDEHNNKMFSYRHIDFTEKEYEYRGFIKHENSYFMVLKSNKDNVFYVKEPNQSDYKKTKGLEKGSSISFEDKTPNNNLIIDDYIKIKEISKLKYEPLDKNISMENLQFKGIRKYKNNIIYLYEDKKNNRIYTQVATMRDIEQFKKQDKENKRNERKNEGITR